MEWFYYDEENKNNREKFIKFVEENDLQECVDLTSSIPVIQMERESIELDIPHNIFFVEDHLIVVPDCSCSTRVFY